MPARYQVDTNGDIALVAATPKTIMNIINAANSLVRLIEFAISFDGVTATAEPVEVELGLSTQAGAGSGSTTHTILQVGGPTRTVQATAQRNYATTEPTVITILKRWRVRADGGLLHIQFPLGREPEQTTTADGLLLRLTAAAAVNVYGHMEFEEG